jgi:hypothetical protein
MRAGGRTRRRAVDALVALVVIALVVAVLARARSNDPRRDETRRKSEPRRAGGFERGGEGGGGDDAALRRAGTTETGMGPGDGKRTVGARGARSGDADARVREPRGGGGEVGAQKRAESVALQERKRERQRDSTDVTFFERAGADVGGRETRRRRPRDLEKVPLPVGRSERRRLADPGGDGDGDGGGGGDSPSPSIGSENAFSQAVARWTRRIVRGGVRFVPRVLLLRRRVRRGGGLLRGLRAARDVRRAENRERARKRSAADAGDVVARR